MTSGRAGRRLLATVAVLVAVSLGLAGCGAFTAMFDTEQALKDAGYQSVHVGFHYGSVDQVDVSVTVSALPAESDTRDVAQVVWRHLHEHFEELNVTVHGDGSKASQQYVFDQLVSMFGARNPSWDRTSISSATKQLGVAVIVGLLVVVAVIVTIVVVATRRSRRRRGPGAGWPPGAPAPTPGPGGPPPPTPGGYPLWPPPPEPPWPPQTGPPQTGPPGQTPG